MTIEKINISSGDLTTGSMNVEVNIEGESNIPFWHHDLKVKAILALLDTIDIKHYYENNLAAEGYKSAESIINAVNVAFGIDIE
jgi:hypothetical protein